MKKRVDVRIKGNINPPDLIIKKPEQIFEVSKKLIEDVGNRSLS